MSSHLFESLCVRAVNRREFRRPRCHACGSLTESKVGVRACDYCHDCDSAVPKDIREWSPNYVSMAVGCGPPCSKDFDRDAYVDTPEWSEFESSEPWIPNGWKGSPVEE